MLLHLNYVLWYCLKATPPNPLISRQTNEEGARVVRGRCATSCKCRLPELCFVRFTLHDTTNFSLPSRARFGVVAKGPARRRVRQDDMTGEEKKGLISIP